MAQQQQHQLIFKIKMVFMLTQTASCHLAVSQDDTISTLPNKATQDLAKASISGNVLQIKQLLSTIKTAPNPRGNMEMFDCIMEYVWQSNVEFILNFGDVHGNTPILCFSLDPRSFNTQMKIFEKLMNGLGDIIDIMHFDKFSKTILISICSQNNEHDSQCVDIIKRYLSPKISKISAAQFNKSLNSQTRDKNQESALYQACSKQSVEIVKLLCDKEWNRNQLNCSLLDGFGR